MAGFDRIIVPENAPEGEAAARAGRLMRWALMGSTAVAGIALAAPAHAQSNVCFFLPLDGAVLATIVPCTGGGGGTPAPPPPPPPAPPPPPPPSGPISGTVTGSGSGTSGGASGGYVQAGTDNSGATINGLVVNNSTGSPTNDAYQQTSASGQNAILTNTGTNSLVTTMSGGAAVSLSSATGDARWTVSQADPASVVNLTGSYGLYASAPAGSVNVVDLGTGGLGTIAGNGTAVAGIYANAPSGSVNLQLKAPAISGFATGISAVSGTGATVTTSGGSIDANGTGIAATASSTGANVTVTSGSAITASGTGIGINASSNNGNTLVTTMAGGTIDGGQTGIQVNTAQSGHSSIVTVGAAIGGTSGPATGINFNGTGTGTNIVNANANITGGSTAAINLGWVDTDLTVKVASGVTVTSAAPFGSILDGHNLTLVNDGTVSNTGNSIFASVLRNSQAPSLIDVTNRGTLSGTSYVIDALGTANVVNSGTMTASTGVAIETGRGGTITNNVGGVIAGGTSSTSGWAIQFASSSSSSAPRVTNNATITGGGAGAIWVDGTVASTLNLNAGSTTTGLIKVTGSTATTTTLAGTLNGLYDNSAGTGAQNFTVASTGSVTGSVLLGAGNDALTISTGAAFAGLDGGAGTDTLALNGTGTGSLNLAAASNFETLSKSGTGTWTLSGASASPSATINAGLGGTPGSGGLLILSGSGLTGTINVNGATVRATSTGAFGTGTINAIDPTIQFAATGAYSNPVVLQSSNPATDPTVLQTFGTGITATLSGKISQSGPTAQPLQFSSVDANGAQNAGTFILTNGANDYAGMTTIAAGTTLVEKNTASALGTGGTSIASGGTLQFDNQTGALLSTEGGTISGAGTLRFTGNAGSITAIGGGANGATTISLSSGGLIDIASGTVNGSSSGQGLWTGNKGDLNIAAGAIFDGVDGNVIVDSLTGAGTLRGGYAGVGSTTIGVDNGSGTFTGTIQNSINANSPLVLIKAGTGTETLTGTNTYTGGTTINGGTLAVQGGSALANTGTVTVGSSGTFSLLGSETIGTLTGSGATSVANGQTLTLSAGGGGTYAGNITGGSLALTSGDWTFNGTRSGAPNVGIVVSGNGTRLFTGTAANVQAGTNVIYLDGSGTSVVNSGTIANSTPDYPAIYINASNATVDNRAGGTISSPSQVMNFVSTGATLKNAGLIAAGNTNNPAVYFASSATVVNSAGGTMSGGGNTLYMAGGGTLTNGGSISNMQAFATVYLGAAGTVTNQAGATIGGGSTGVRFAGGGTLTNQGSISGSVRGVYGEGAALSVTNGGTISGGTGVVVTAGGTVTNQAGGKIQGTSGPAVDATGTVLTLTNSGMLTSSGGNAIQAASATVTNNAGGTIQQTSGSGGAGIFSNGALTLTNDGAISTVATGTSDGVTVVGTATITNNGTINAATASGIAFVGAGSQITNSGTITGGTDATYGYGVQGSAQGTVTNKAGGLITGGTGGIVAFGGAMTVANSGRVTGGNYGTLGSAGTLALTNNAGGQIVGGNTGVETRGLSTISNAGVIGSGTVSGSAYTQSGQDGIRFMGGGTVDNLAGGHIGGGAGAGVYVEATSSTPATTITNSGLIDGNNGVYTSNSYANPLTVTNQAGGTINAFNGTALYIGSGALVVTNAGSISGSSSLGVGARSLTLDNKGSITGFISTGSGVNLSIVNRAGGTIVSNASAGDLMYPVDAAVSILNAGTISAAGFSATGVEGSAGTAVITNAAGGIIQGGNDTSYGMYGNAVQFGGQSLTFNNYSSATSAGGQNAILGASGGAATINLFAGSTTGNIGLGSGDDILALYSGRGTNGAATVDATTGITLQNAGTLAAASVGTIDLGGGANTLVLAGTGDDTAANGVAGSIGLDSVGNLTTLTKQDAGTWTLTGAARGTTAGATINAGTGGTPGSGGLLIFSGTDLTGTINVNGAAVRATSTGAFGTGTINAIDPTIQFAASGTYSNPIVLQSVDPANDPTTLQTYGTGITATLSGAITEASGGQPLVFSSIDMSGNPNAGTFILTNTGNGWTGTTTIDNGTTLQGTTGTISGGDIADNGLLVYAQDTDGTVGQAISGTGALVKDGTGTVTLTQHDSYSGGTSVLAGTLVAATVPGSYAADALGNGTVSIAGGATVRYVNPYDTQNPGPSNAQIYVSENTFSGAGTLQFTGGAGSLTVIDHQQPGGANVALAAGGLVDVQSGAVLARGAGVFTGNQASLNIAANARFEGASDPIVVDALTGAGGYSGDSSLTLGIAGGSGTFAGTIADSTAPLALTKVGAGTETLTGTNTYTGTTTISGGTLALSGTGSIANSAVTDDAAFDISSLTNGGTSIVTLLGSGTVALGTNTLTLSDGSGTFSGAIAGTGGFTKDGAGTYTLSGANSYTGLTTVAAGTLSLAGGAAIADTGAVNIASGATLDLADSETIGSLAGDTGSFVTLGANTLTAGGNNASTTFAGSISGSGGLTKEGAGTLTLTGANSYGGTTTINAGTLSGTTDSIAGSAIVDNATLAYVQSYSGIVGQDISGSGVVTISGLSAGEALTVNGNDSVAQGFIVTDASTLINTGTIAALDAVRLAGGGAFDNRTVVNGAVSNLGAAPATVTNTGSINGTIFNVGTGLLTIDNQVGGAIVSNPTAIVSTAGGAILLNNAGDISGSARAVQSQNSSDVINNSGRMVAGTFTGPTTYDATGGNGIAFYAGGTLNNLAGGLVAGGTNEGVYATGFLTVTNAAGATITGSQAIDAYNGADITNAGTISASGSDYAIGLTSGATIVNSGTITGGTAITAAGSTLLITSQASGTISGTAGNAIFSSAGTTTLDNSGTIQGSGVGLWATGAAKVTNNANASVSGNSTGILINGAFTLTNSGTVSAGANGNAAGVLAGGGSSGTIDNKSGALITGDRSGIAQYGTALTVTNSGQITSTGAGGAGIAAATGTLNLTNNAGAFVVGVGSGINATPSVTITNAGTIGSGTMTSGGVFTANAGTGIQLFNGGTISNSGTIAGGVGIFENGSSAFSVDNKSGGTISGTNGAVQSYSTNATVTNAGSITSSGSSAALNLFGNAGTSMVTNNSGSTISGGRGIYAANTLTLSNAGTVSGTSNNAVLATGANTSLSNSGVIQAATTGGVSAVQISGGTITNDAGATIRQTAAGGGAGIVSFGALSLTNNGAISTAASAGYDAVTATGTATVTNAANATITAATGSGVSYGASGSQIGNSGTITGGASGYGVRAQGSGTITNAAGARITGGAGGIAAFSGTVTVTNSGTITGTGAGGTGITETAGTLALNNNNGGKVVGTSTGARLATAGTITNAGLIGTGSVAANGTYTGNNSGYGLILSGGGTVVNSGTITASLGISSTSAAALTVTNQSGGAITGVSGNAINGASAAASITNSGSITGTATYSGIFLNGTSGTTIVANNAGGTISGYDGVYAANALTLTNSGTISGLTRYGVLGGGAGSAITNTASGTISGYRGVGLGNVGTFDNFGHVTGTIDNAVSLFGGGNATNHAGAVLTADGAGGYGVYTHGTGIVDNQGTIHADSGLVTDVSGATFTNEGLITAAVNGVWGSGAGINLANSGTINAGSIGVRAEAAGSVITNSGTIAGTTSGAQGVYMSGGTLTNLSGGTITGNGTGAAIYVTGVSNVVSLNAGSTTNGLVDGSTTTGDANSYLVAGKLNGALTAGSGNDRVTLVTGAAVSGTLDGGAGIDTLVLDGTATGTLGSNAVNFENGIKTGTGTWMLTGTTSPTSWAISADTLAVSGGNAINDVAAVTIAPNGTLALLSSERIGSLGGAGGVSLGGNTLFTGTDNKDSAFAGVIFGSGSLYKDGTGTFALSGANSYTGATTVVGGTLGLGASNTLSSSTAVTVQNAVLDLGAYSNTVASLAANNATIAGTGTLTAATYALTSATVNGNLGGGALTQQGGVSVLNGTSAAGTVEVAAGTLQLGASDRLADAAAVAVDSGATLDLLGFNDTIGSVGIAGTLNGTGTLNAATYALNGALVNANLGIGTLSNVGGVSLLNGAAGAASVNVGAGTLRLGAAERLANAATVTVSSGAILDLQGYNETIGSVGIAGTLNGSGTLTAAQYGLNGAVVNANLGTGTLFNLGGTSLLNGTSAASAVEIAAGTLRLGKADRLASSAVVQVDSNGTLDLAGFAQTVGQLTGNGAVALGSGALSVGAGNQSSVFAGQIGGSGSLQKIGTGLFVYGGSQTYTGGTVVTAGELRLLGTTAGGVKVNGGTFSGGGAIAGQLSLSGGTISPGVGAGGFSGFQAGSFASTSGTLAIDVAPKQSDGLSVTGAATLNGGTVVTHLTGDSGQYSFVNFYTVLNAGSVNGRFDNPAGLVAAGTSGDLFQRLRYDLVPNAVVLEIRRLVDFTAGAGSLTGNQAQVAAALNGTRMDASDSFGNLLNNLSLLSGADRAAAYDSLSGAAAANTSTAVMMVSDRFMDLLGDRLLGDGNGASNDSAQGYGSGYLPSASNPMNALRDPGSHGAAGSGAWLKGYGFDTTLKGAAGQAGVRGDGYGVAAGLEVNVGRAATLGGAVGYTDFGARTEALATRATGHSWQGGVYGRVGSDNAYISGSASYVHADVDTRRQVAAGLVGGTARGKTGVRVVSGALAAGYKVPLAANAKLGLLGSLRGSRVDQDGYTETGGVFALRYGSQRREFAIGTGLIQLENDFATRGSATVTAYLRGGIAAVTGDRASALQSSFTAAPAGTGSFTIAGVSLPKSWAVLGAGLNITGADQPLTVSVRYEGHYAERLHDNQVSVGVALKF